VNSLPSDGLVTGLGTGFSPGFSCSLTRWTLCGFGTRGAGGTGRTGGSKAGCTGIGWFVCAVRGLSLGSRFRLIVACFGLIVACFGLIIACFGLIVACFTCGADGFFGRLHSIVSGSWTGLSGLTAVIA